MLVMTWKKRKDDVCSTCEVLRKNTAAATEEQEKLELSASLVHHVAEHSREERGSCLQQTTESQEEFFTTSKLYNLKCQKFTYSYFSDSQ